MRAIEASGEVEQSGMTAASATPSLPPALGALPDDEATTPEDIYGEDTA
jgi:hypothetical protein